MGICWEVRKTLTEDIPPGQFGLYRRRVRIVGTEGRCSVDIEDDQHRFGADIDHDGAKVLAVHGRAPRTPWTTCPAAIAQLQILVGTPLLPSPFAVLRQVVLAQQCTHLVDMAVLAVAAAARGLRYRQYDATLSIEDRDGSDWRTGTLERSDGGTTRWTFRDGFVVEPESYAGLEMRRAASWIGDHSDDPDIIEEAFVMQRSLLVAGGRRVRLDVVHQASDQVWMLGACYSFQPDRVDRAKRIVGSSRTFADPDDLLTDLGPEPAAH
jgi:hypothetical protein